MKLVFLGPPGAGKGTQAKIFAEKLNILHISTGDIFRENMKNKTLLGVKAKEIVDAGNLVPDEITNAMVKERLEQDDTKSGYILDGYPRTLPQAKFLFTIQELDRVVYFYLNEKTAVKRLVNRAKDSGRADDNEDIIKNRLKVYQELTQPLIEYYKNKGLLLEINAEPTIEVISKDLETKL